MVSKDKVRELIKDYSAEKFAAVIKLCCAPAIFADADKTVSVEFEKGAKQKVRILGVVTDLPGEKGSSAPLLVADIDLGGKELTERSSRTRQFKIARKTLEALFDNPPVQIKGFLTQGIFAFHDNDGHFRVSLVTATAEKGSFKYSSAKRQSFYVTPDPEGNATFVQRMTMDWSSLAAIKGAFSVDRLTRQFYNEIQNWYFWAQLPEQHVSFPNDINDDTDDAKFNSENLIRLITRIVFTWFLKEKGLVNSELFETGFLTKALKHFSIEGRINDPSAKDAHKACTYYRAILQNLFFATFNQEIKNRGFIKKIYKNGKVISPQRHIKTAYRNAVLFNETDTNKIGRYFNSSPFVNGGLFECLDDQKQLNKKTGATSEYAWDGFSDNITEDGHLVSALIPDRLFFSDETTCDLSSFIEGKAAKNIKVRGLIRILESYNFTIEENSPTDEEVALDPELLGKVFENLLGCFNPETQKMARNSTGSFYTPREEVNYMVGESLVAYLRRALKGIPESEIRQLVAGGAELDDLPKIKARVKEVLAVIFRMKILDPACGSGAFPMGALLAIVEMLRTLDPSNKLWRQVVIEESKKKAEANPDAKNIEEIVGDIEKSFDMTNRYPDYARKLYVIQHCIFGSDIQPIAVQISRLRFFISLLCEQKKTDDPAENYGVTPLPNLENNFVAANSLLSIDIGDMREILQPREVSDARTREGKESKIFEENKARLIEKILELKKVRNQLFMPKTSEQKKRLRAKDEELRKEIESLTVVLCDTRLKEQENYLEEKLSEAKKKLGKSSEGELNASTSTIQDAWFGVATKTKKTTTLRAKLTKEIAAYESKLAEIRNDSNKQRLLKDVCRLINWNPFSFNVAEDFLDPEWMFGVKDGFDIVIGNPPYIQLQANKGALAKLYEEKGFVTFDRTGDIYCLFYEKGWLLLSANGVLCYITSDKWMRNEYGRKFRNFLRTRTDCELLIDFTGQVFDSATVETNILLFGRESLGKCQPLSCNVSSDEDINSAMTESQKVIRCEFDNDDSWAILDPLEAQLKKKMENVGKRIKDWDLRLNRGLVTGLNPAFLIDDETRKRLIIEDPKSTEIIKPVLRGRDVTRYRCEQSMWIIDSHNGVKLEGIDRVDVSKYQAVKQHLDGFKKELEKRGDKGDTPYNLRDCAYWLDLGKEKIIWGELSDNAKFAFSKAYLVNTCVFMVGKHLKYVLGVLNSQLAAWYFKFICTKSGMGTVRWYKGTVELLPVVKPDVEHEKMVEKRVDAVLSEKKANPAADTGKLEREIDDIVFDLYGLTKEEREIVVKACEKPVKEEKKAKVKGEEVKAKKPVIEEEF